MNGRLLPPGRAQRGASLLEIAIVIVVLGVLTVLVANVATRHGRMREEHARRDLLERADDAIIAFAAAHDRLPCPAVDSAGDEDCGTSAQVGRLPWRTLQLPDARGGRLRYGVLRRGAVDVEADADLSRARPRFRALVLGAAGATEVLPGAGAADNGLDFCQGLRTAMTLPSDPTFLHVRRADDSEAVAGNVAYALAVSENDGAFTGTQGLDAAGFDSPRRPRSDTYSDRTRVVGMAEAWQRLRCGDVVAAAGHAHFNVALAAAVMRYGAEEYLVQMKLRKRLADAEAVMAAAGIVAGAAAISAAAADLVDAQAEAAASTGAKAWLVPLATASVAAAAAAEAAAVAAQVQAAIAAAQAQADVDALEPLVDDARALETRIRTNAEAAYAAGTYEEQ
ncbi:hypothetical protein [Coralloluteibacterium stylophorae]|uniref:Prepilin-type N-terminal cleavage/methylation domain-containing protein n=2 Tax=Coralloluteibacterium stylophorae TaxID=1776034 RepID=A0AAP2C9K8_9GAMM|nr:hypothetical protein [Coralloluteibacterium stylophorae]MBS7456803.1 hypothetical protein [Coralloluteibacterium stylophorae]